MLPNVVDALLPAGKYQRRGEIQNHAAHAYVAEESAQESRFVKSTEAEFRDLEVRGVLVLRQGAVRDPDSLRSGA